MRHNLFLKLFQETFALTYTTDDHHRSVRICTRCRLTIRAPARSSTTVNKFQQLRWAHGSQNTMAAKHRSTRAIRSTRRTHPGPQQPHRIRARKPRCARQLGRTSAASTQQRTFEPRTRRRTCGTPRLGVGATSTGLTTKSGSKHSRSQDGCRRLVVTADRG